MRDEPDVKFKEELNQHKNVALLIDAYNVDYSKIKEIVKEISSHGYVPVKRAYGDWLSSKLKNWKQPLNELAIQQIQQFTHTADKNAANTAMIIDAMDLLHSKKFDVFVIVSSDRNFTNLASRLREARVFVVGVGEQDTSISFSDACDEFIFSENLDAGQGAKAPYSDGLSFKNSDYIKTSRK